MQSSYGLHTVLIGLPKPTDSLPLVSLNLARSSSVFARLHASSSVSPRSRLGLLRSTCPWHAGTIRSPYGHRWVLIISFPVLTIRLAGNIHLPRICPHLPAVFRGLLGSPGSWNRPKGGRGKVIWNSGRDFQFHPPSRSKNAHRRAKFPRLRA